MGGHDVTYLLRELILEKKPVDRNPRVTGLAYHSGRVEKGYLFFALKGLRSDGHSHVEAAADRGAAAIVHSRVLPRYRPDLVYVLVSDARAAMSLAASRFYGAPSKDLTVIGVTGTDGKSTTVWLINQLLEKLDKRCGFISTATIKTAKETQKNPLRQSTPEAPEVHRLLQAIRDGGNEYAVVEATSHGLSDNTKRLHNVLFDVAVLTNVTREHLEFHGSLEQYRSDKANLFRSLGNGNQNCFGVVNGDDAHHAMFAAATAFPVFTYSTRDPGADLFARAIAPCTRGTRFELVLGDEIEPGELPLPGLFNLSNLMAATLTVAKLLSLPLCRINPLFPGLTNVKGRMQDLEMDQPFKVIVDFAHTPGAFEALFSTMRPRVARKLIAIFGSAGERDSSKRPIQGGIASRYADVIILTDEDPRAEDRQKILEDIAAGCGNKKRNIDLFLVPDREKAIRFGISMAGEGDAVLCLGKGHEESIIYSNGSIKWNETEVVAEILKKDIRRRDSACHSDSHFEHP